MNDKTKLLNITLSVLLGLSMASTYVLLNQISSSKKTLAALPTQLSEAQAKLQAVKGDRQTLEAKLATPTQVATVVPVVVTGPADPNKMLSSQLTLARVKVMAESERKRATAKGWTEEQIVERLTRRFRYIT